MDVVFVLFRSCPMIFSYLWCEHSPGGLVDNAHLRSFQMLAATSAAADTADCVASSP